MQPKPQLINYQRGKLGFAPFWSLDPSEPRVLKHNVHRVESIWVILSSHRVCVNTYLRAKRVFSCVPESLRITPAMAAGVTDHVWSTEEIAEIIEVAESKPGKRGPCKARYST